MSAERDAVDKAILATIVAGGVTMLAAIIASQHAANELSAMVRRIGEAYARDVRMMEDIRRKEGRNDE